MSKTLVWAHRGASGYAPENTIPAFQKAIEMGADGIELDVQLTKDGELVVVHDETLERVSDGRGWVKDYTLAELKRMNFNQQFPEYGRGVIPTLEEVYQLIEPTSLTINVELKTGIVFYENIEEKVLELTDRYGMEKRVIYSSFNHYTVRRMKEMRPEVETGMLYADGIIDAASYGRQKVHVDAMHPALYNLQFPGFVQSCRDEGLKLHVWTVNEEAHMRMVCEQGAEAMITNYPDRGQRIVAEYSTKQ